jgi:uncharacterized protein DUF5317
MLVPIALLAVVLLVPVAGGRLAGLADLRFAALPLLLGALAIQLLIFEPGPITGGPLWYAGLALSYALGFAFALRNRAIPFLWLVILGGMLNVAAIAANGGVMPADPGAAATAGLAQGGRMANSAVVGDAHLALLGDVFAIPAGWPLSNVFSLGDILLVLGAGLMAHRVCGSRLLRAAS